MTAKSGYTLVPFRWSSLSIYMGIGSLFALLAIGLLIGSVKNPDPAWGEYWMLKPLVIVPAAGAFGGFCFYTIRRALNTGTIPKIVGVFLGTLVYIIGLWMGTVLGLNGTLWN